MTLPWPSQVEVLVDMARDDGGWRPFPLFHVPCTKEPLPVGNSGVKGVVRSDKFNQASVPLLSEPSAYGGTSRSVEHGTAVRVLAECVGDHKERFFQVAVLVPRATPTASKRGRIGKLLEDMASPRSNNEDNSSADVEEGDGEWVTGYVRSAQLCNLYLTRQGPADPAVAVANCAPTTQTPKAKLTYGVQP